MVTQEIISAVESGNLEALRQFDSSVLKPELTDDFGSNCLHYAARQGGADVLHFLVHQRGFTSKVRSNIGATPLHDAAAAGNLEGAQWLVEHTQCSVNDQDGTGATPLHLACRFHHTSVTEWLLDVGKADTSIDTASGGLPVHFAVVGGDYDAVKLLLENDPSSEVGEKFNANDRDFDGVTPIHFAASQGHAQVIDWLMKVGGAKVTLDNLGGSPLHNAAENNQTEQTVDEDIAYLNSVQSPRQPLPHQPPVNYSKPRSNYPTHLGNKQPLDYRKHQPESTEQNNNIRFAVKNYRSNHPAARENTPIGHLVNVANGNESLTKPQSPDVDYSMTQIRLFGKGDKRSPERPTSPEPDYSLARSGLGNIHTDTRVPRLQLNGSNDNSNVGNQSRYRPASIGSNSSDSSLSSLSQLDEAIAFAEKTVAREEKRAKELMEQKQANTGSRPKPGPSVIQVRKLPVKSASELHGAGNVREERDKTVKFMLNDHGNDGTYDDAYSAKHASKGNIPVEKRGNMKHGIHQVSVKPSTTNRNSAVINLPIRSATNGETDDHTGLVNGTVPVYNLNSVSSAQMASNAHVHNVPINVGTVSPLVNGTGPSEMEAPPHPHVYPPSNNIIGSSFYDVYQSSIATDQSEETRHNGNQSEFLIQNANIPIPPPPPPCATTTAKKPMEKQTTINVNSASGNQHSTTNHFQAVNGSQEHQPAPSAQENTGKIPVPPPPPPAVNGNQPKPLQNGTQNESIEEIKRKSASLPARPQALFTPEMMQSQLNTLSPAQARVAIENNSNTDFLAELKLATKGGGLRKTGINGDPGATPAPKPITAFNGGQKTDLVREKPTGEKDVKMKLEGEWDPKNFVDQVPNRKDLPAWKVQLQARQIAEKVEDREARFKGMPAWKRAIVERKEAEARAAEEKKLTEQQRMHKVVNKKMPAVNLVGKSGDTGLAPWQKELQGK
ncbi:ESPNL-like protein [Mya arenaria]|uniref:ESPNL-like protein n=1 Tax=Mya arenaria TaxID=6604 RepID=A0ABY7F360_MYAAR|nr:ESPNL-like protein [Mya arenaria]